MKKTLVSHLAEPEKRSRDPLSQKTKSTQSNATHNPKSINGGIQKPQNSASRRLFAALEFSDHSSDEGSISSPPVAVVDKSKDERASYKRNKTGAVERSSLVMEKRSTALNGNHEERMSDKKMRSANGGKPENKRLSTNGAVYREALIEKYHINKDRQRYIYFMYINF